jgi:hypothetical protein
LASRRQRLKERQLTKEEAGMKVMGFQGDFTIKAASKMSDYIIL